MKKLILFFITLNSIAVFAQNNQEGRLYNVNSLRDIKLLINKDETHCFLHKGGAYGLIYDLQTGKQVKEVVFYGFTKDSGFKTHFFDYKNDKALIAGFDQSGNQSEHIFLWDEASGKFHAGKDLPTNHGIVHDIIGDEIVYAFPKFAKDKKGKTNFNKIEESFVQFYNWKTQKWRLHTYPFEIKDIIDSRSVAIFKDGNKVKFLDLNTLSFLKHTSNAYDALVTYYTDGKVYAAVHKEGVDRIAPVDPNTLQAGRFQKAPSSNYLDYHSGEMRKYHVRLEGSKNVDQDYDVDLIINNKENGDRKTIRVTTSDKEQIKLVRNRIDAIEERRLNKSNAILNEKYADQISELREWEVNFDWLPNEYTHNYNHVKGRDITNYKMSKRLFRTPNTTTYAIGKISECDDSKTFLVMLMGPQAEGTESVFAVLKTDHYGNRLQYQIIARSVANNLGYTQMDEFAISTSYNKTTIHVVENYMGEKKNRQYTIYCNN